MKRRNFILQSTLAMGALSVPVINTKAESMADPPDPDPRFLCEEVNLWKDGSANNGSNPEYRPKIRIYYPTLRQQPKKKLAAILVCPGGGYYVQAPHEGQPFAQLFSNAGIVGVVLTYRVNPDRYPGSYSDAVRAIRYLRHNADKYNIDPERIGIMGFSAGGHLASTVATQPDLYKNPEDDLAGTVSAKTKRVMLGYPVISFMDDFAHMGSVHALLGENPDPAMQKQLTNYLQVTKDSPAAFLFHTATDETVPVENSIRFAEACIKNKVPVETHIFQSGPHGVGMALEYPELRIWIDNLMNWLDDWVYKG